MANTTLAPVAISQNGVDISNAALVSITSGNGIAFANSGNLGVIIYNGSTGTLICTPVITAAIESVVPTNTRTVSIPTTKSWILGPYSPAHFNQNFQPGGTMVITLSGVTTTVAAAVISIPTVSP